jgi:hypothetical protein
MNMLGMRYAFPVISRGVAVRKVVARLAICRCPRGVRRTLCARLIQRRFVMASAGFEIIPKASIGNPRKNGLDQTDIDPGALWA